MGSNTKISPKDENFQMVLPIVLRRLLEECHLPARPEGPWSWSYVLVMKSPPQEDGSTLFTIRHSIRGDTQVKTLMGTDQFSPDNPVILMTVGHGGDYFAKLLKRIFKEKRIDMLQGHSWFRLNDADVEWLQQFRFADAFHLPKRITETSDIRMVPV
jgi:hypothetical protein